MEDKSNSRTKKVQDTSLENTSNDGPLFSGAHLYSEKPSNSNYLNVELNNGLLHLALPKKTCNKNAISMLKEQLDDIEGYGLDVEKKNQKPIQAFWRGFNKFTTNISTSNQNLHDLFLRRQTINLLHSELYSWHTLLRHLVSMPSFSNFNICQVLCHEKGTTNVLSYSVGTDNLLQESKTSIESFNKVFGQIKKSKGNQFSQTQLSIPEFNFVGSFLASIFQLKTHNVLFLLSENSFFPIPENIIDEVDLVLPQIKSVLEKVIHKDLSDSKISNLFRVFELLPNPVSIQNHLDNIIFQNDSFKKFSSGEGADHSKLFQAKLNNGYKLLMQLNSEFSKSDVQHFQRVGLLGELLNTLQHELSNPLFGIQLATDFLKLQPSDDSITESLSEISENCKRCQDIIRDFKFIYQGGDKFLDVDLKKIIKETLTLTKSASRGIQKEIIFKSNIETFNTNPTWLSQIIFNLIINSSQAILPEVKDSGKGIIKILVASKGDRYLKITISDNGPGIDESEESSIFDPFYTTKEKGTGLGLAICLSLCEKLGGTMTYNKNEMSGASFSLLLPINEIYEE